MPHAACLDAFDTLREIELRLSAEQLLIAVKFDSAA
jgi:hypothetical protein